ncbi:hypothetical protein CRG98_011083, partial [Punica granatum]
SSAGSSNQVDLFGDSLIGDLLDTPVSADPVPSNGSSMNKSSSDVDLFADATFVSAPPPVEPAANSQKQTEVDLFSSIPAVSPPVPATVDLFSAPDPVVPPETNPTKSVPANTSAVDPFAAVPLNNFDGSDPFGAFTFSDPVSAAPSQNQTEGSGLGDLSAIPSVGASPPPAKDGFQVKSGIWADSLSRGIIDLNISAPKKVSLADVGVVGALSDGSDEREKGPPASYSMGRAMGAGSGLGKSGFPPALSAGVDGFFSSFASQPYQYNSFKKLGIQLLLEKGLTPTSPLPKFKLVPIVISRSVWHLLLFHEAYGICFNRLRSQGDFERSLKFMIPRQASWLISKPFLEKLVSLRINSHELLHRQISPVLVRSKQAQPHFHFYFYFSTTLPQISSTIRFLSSHPSIAKFCFFALIALLSVHLALSAYPPQISPSSAPKLAADSTPTISPSKPTASLAPAPTNAPHGSISSSPSLLPLDAAPVSSPSTSPPLYLNLRVNV